MVFLAIFLGVIVAIIIIVLIGIMKIKKAIGTSSFKLITDYIKEGRYETEEDAYSKDKSLAGMTSIYEPKIRDDFPDFNLSLLYTNIEKNLRSILNAKTNKDKKLLDDEQLVLIKNNVIKEIDDLSSNNIDVSYKDISFNKHVIKSYKKDRGTATITVALQVSYYYDSNDSKNKYSHIKKSTIYVCDYIYVYDEVKFAEHEKVITINCPNCGAPLKGLDGGNCVYCGSFNKPINLKAWKLASYKEDKR